MSVGRDEVREVARLARLDLSEDELERFTPQLANIFGHIDELRDVEPEPDGGTDTGLRAPLRADEVGADPLVRPPSAMAPDWRDGFFAVPRLAAQETPSTASGGTSEAGGPSAAGGTAGAGGAGGAGGAPHDGAGE